LLGRTAAPARDGAVASVSGKPRTRTTTMKLAEQLELILDNRIAQDNLTLPLLPAVAAKANDVSRRTDATTKDLVAAIELDPILAALVMHQVAGMGCRTTEQAVTKLGPHKIRTILGESSSRRVMESRDPKSAEATRLIWEHGRAVAILAQDVAVLAGVEEPEVCHLAGLLHDIGKSVVATMLLEAEAQIAQRNPKLWIDGDTWVGVVDRTHRKVGLSLAKKWQFSEEVQSAVLEFSDFDVANRQSIANAVHFGNALAKQLGICLGEVSAEDNDALVMVGRSLLGIDEDGIARVTADIKTRCKLS
jgi:putative nucleotidyltransferase with HDIG domain